jgi:hypothetical protein
LTGIYNQKQEEFEDTKGIIRICISKDRQHNGQKKKDKQRSTKHTHKTIDRVTRTPLKTGGELRSSERVSSSCSTSGIHCANLVTNLVICEEKTGKCLRQVDISVDNHQVMVAIVKLLRWWHQFNRVTNRVEPKTI